MHRRAAHRPPRHCRLSRPAPNARSNWVAARPLDDRQRRSRVLFENRRLRAALYPHDAGQLRRGGQAAVPARSLPARPRRHRARAAVHDEVDDGLHVEAARPWRRSLHAAAVQPIHECEPLRRRNRWFRGHRVCRQGLPDRSKPHRHDRVFHGWCGGMVLHRAPRGSLGRGVGGRRLHRDRGVSSRGAAQTAAECRAADALAHVRHDRLRREHVQRAGRRVLRRHRRTKAGGGRDGGGDAAGGPHSRARDWPRDRSRL